MPARTLAALCLVALAACSRDLDLPSSDPLSVSPPFTQVAPRETVSLAASGGAGGYTFAFADGGQLSGGDATVGASGTYQAGSLGSAQDVIEVRDASGAVALARITVGARLSVTPWYVGTAPLGTLSFTVSGGKPAPGTGYGVDTAGIRSEGAISGQPGGPFVYRAGSKGNVRDDLVFTDSLGVAVTAQVVVGTVLQLFRPQPGDVAPHESVQFIAAGGQPSYAYSLQPGGSGGSINALTGMYTAGDDGGSAGASDVVQVTDANGGVETMAVRVGPVLDARIASTRIRPGISNRVAATGGKPPYAFRFAARGNRSHGEVDGISGAYVPGPSPGARDVLEVWDATGLASVTLALAPVGPIELTAGASVDRCLAADFDGNGLEDVAYLHRQMALTEITQVATDAPFARRYWVGSEFGFPAAFPADYDGDRQDELAFAGGRDGIAGGQGLWFLDPDLSGGLGVAEAPLGTFVLSGRAGARTWATNRWGDPAWSFFFDAAGSGSCASTAGNVARFDGPPTAGAWCQPVTAPGPGGAISGMAAGDLDGDGHPDLVWLESVDPTFDSLGPLHVRFEAELAGTLAARGAVAGGDLALPDGGRFVSRGDGGGDRLVVVPRVGAATRESLLVRYVDGASGRGELMMAAADPGQPLRWIWGPLDVDAAAGAAARGVDGVAVYLPFLGARPRAVTWNDVDGALWTFELDPDSATTPSPERLPDAPFSVTAACTPDANGDGAPDLVLASGTSSDSILLWGDGGRTFGARPHFRGMTWPVALGHLDGVAGFGDGLGDLVAGEEGGGVRVLLGGEDQLAWGERPISPETPVSIAAGPFVSEKYDSVLYQDQANAFHLVDQAAGPTVSPPVDVPSEDGLPVSTSFMLLWPAWLGGSDPGPDLVSMSSDNFGTAWMHVLVRRNGRIADVVSPQLGNGGAVAQKTRDCWPLAAGVPPVPPARDLSPAGLLALCLEEEPAPPHRANAVQWFGTGFAGADALADWVTGVPTTGSDLALQPSIGVGGTLEGKAIFVVERDEVEVWAFTLGGDPTLAASWSLSIGRTGLRGVRAMLGTLADVDGDGSTDLVASGEGGTVVLWNYGSDGAPDFEVTAARRAPERLGASGLVFGAAPLRAGALPSILTIFGDFFENTGLPTEIVPLVNEGGRLR